MLYSKCSVSVRLSKAGAVCQRGNGGLQSKACISSTLEFCRGVTASSYETIAWDQRLLQQIIKRSESAQVADTQLNP